MRSSVSQDTCSGRRDEGEWTLAPSDNAMSILPILFACWEQSRLHGNDVTLERFDDNEAVVTADSIYLRL